MPDEITIVAIVFALILLLVFFSAAVLYLAFRVKETFRKETRRGSTIVKTAFLIGVLFLAGGLFYFFASSLTTMSQNPPTPTTSPTLTPTFSPSTSATPTNSEQPSHLLSPTPSNPASQTPGPTTTPSSTPTQTPIQKVSFTASYPPTSKMNTSLTVTFTIINSADAGIQGAVIQTNGLLQDFTVQQCNYPIVGNAINVGALPSGTTIVSLQLFSPNRPVNFGGTVSLVHEDMLSPLTQQITIAVRGN